MLLRGICMKQKTNLTTHQLAVTALMAAVMCVLGPLSLPIGPVPISLTNLVVFFSALLLGARLGTLSVAVYLALGAVGLPVFSGYGAGLAKLAGPTGGYLIGFLPLALLVGLCAPFAEKPASAPARIAATVAALLLGEAALYVLGTAWFCRLMDCTVSHALGLCVLPFLPGDGLKVAVAALLAPLLKKRLQAAGVRL